MFFLLLLATLQAAPGPTPRARVVASVPTALTDLLARRPRVVAFGEIHQTTASLRVPSSLAHFNDELLAVVAPRAAELVVETWVTQGKCGKTETAVIEHVEKTTERPAQTEDEVVTLLRRAKAAGVEPHILTITCREYETIYTEKEVDYDALLRLTSDKLADAIRAGLSRHGAGDNQRAIVVYGGALHNDLAPAPGLSAYTFGETISKAVDGKYLEIDLYVPEYVEKQNNLRAQPWYAAYRRVVRPGRAVLIERRPDSYVIVFPRTPPSHAGPRRTKLPDKSR